MVRYAIVRYTKEIVGYVDGEAFAKAEAKFFANHDDDDTVDDVWYEIDTFLPILLTQDILEKNGWTEIVLKDRFYNQDFAMPVLTKSFDKRNLFWFYISETPVFPINYVHELQNLLHLCGIEKEIEL